MKIIAFYLPQFHEIEENNEWWGEGFTEWTNVKKAKQLFKGHYQPRLPYKDNYYDLSEKKALINQSALMRKYGVDGLAIYHYWFGDRMILEKPSEIILEEKEIEIPFCFFWANHTWQKTWNGSKEVLIQQEYGDKQEWQKHIDYLMVYFKDPRYIKQNNMPVLLIFSPKDIPMLDDRILFYDHICKKNGFNGIYIIESINNASNNKVSIHSKGSVLRQPNIGVTSHSIFHRITHNLKTKFRYNFFLKPKIYDYDKISQLAISHFKKDNNKKQFLCAFTSWDSTPRHSRRGYVVTGSTPEKFGYYFEEQFKISKERKNEFLFINAWNEWAEGMYLEADKKYGERYLKQVLKTKNKNL